MKSAMRRASRRLWVTITIVTSGVISRIRSSMREVLIGSSADAGSSISRMSGSIARARAITRRCCWPPESASALSRRRSFTSSRSAAHRNARSTMSWMSPWNPSVRGPNATLSKIDFGNGLGRWKTRPMRVRTATGSTSRP